jgi:hypothetical protein
MAAWCANHSPQYAARAGAAAQVLLTMRGMQPGSNLHEARIGVVDTVRRLIEDALTDKTPSPSGRGRG